MKKNSIKQGNQTFVNIIRIEDSKCIDKVTNIPVDFIQPVSLKSSWKDIRDKKLFFLKNSEIEQKLDKILAK